MSAAYTDLINMARLSEATSPHAVNWLSTIPVTMCRLGQWLNPGCVDVSAEWPPTQEATTGWLADSQALCCKRLSVEGTSEGRYPQLKGVLVSVADWLERLTCNVASTDSSFVWDSYRVGTLSKFFTPNYSAIPLHFVLPKHVRELLNFLWERWYQCSVVCSLLYPPVIICTRRG